MQQCASFGPEPFTERVRLVAADSATRLAIVYPRPVTYGELLRAATQVARGLRALGLAAGAPVPVWTGCPIDGITASLGVALAGGAFVPVDPRAPLARARFVIGDCRPLITIVDRERGALLCGQEAGEALTTEQLAARGEAEAAPLVPVSAEQAACLIYTSGSTGQPKGVVLTHANLSSMLASRRAVHGGASRVLPIHPCSFDAFQGAVLWSLCSGGSLALLEGDQILDPETIVGVIERHGVATISAVPSMYQALLRMSDPGRLASLRSTILGGEAMSPELAALHFSQLRAAALFNEYGPTECSVFSTAYRVPEFPPTPIPIGKPVGDVVCQVVGAGGAPCGPLEEGELYIGGPGVARGYWRQDALTAERFVTLPALADGTRLYRTGDRVRWNARGELEFLGRIDDQIKLRGNRIEPAEIERAISALPGVLAVAVVLNDCREGGGQAGPRLVAFYVTERGAPLLEPRQRLADQLPSYMMPSLFTRLDAMPALSNGKIDRRALAGLPLDAETPAEAPGLTPAERQVAEVWARVLGVPVDSIGRDADFFGLGGHSLLVTAVRGALAREVGRTAPEEVFFARSRLGELARALLPVVPAEETTASGGAPPTVLPLAPIQETFYYLAQIEPDSAAYVVPATLRIVGPLDRGLLRAAARAVVRGNELLRARVDRRGDEPALVIAPIEAEEAWFRWDERDVAPGEDAGALVQAFEAGPIAIAGPALARFQLLRVPDDEHYLTLAAHHILVDGASVGLIVEELLARYREPSSPGNAKAGYGAFVAVSRARLAGERLERLHEFWRDHLRGVGAPAIPPDYLAGEARTAASAAQPTSVVRPLSAALGSRIHGCARAQRATPFVTALGAVGVTLRRWLPDRELVVGSPVSLRGLGPFEATIGCMVNSVAIKLPVGDGQQTFATLVGAVRASVLESMRHAELPIAWLHAGRGRARGDAAVPMFRTFFNYLDRGQEQLNAGGVRFEPCYARRPIAKFDLTVYLHDWGGRMDLELVYPPDRYDQRTMSELARQIEEVLEQVTQAPELTLDAVQLDRRPRQSAPVPPPPFDPTATIQAGFAANTRLRAAELAVADERGNLTYRELARRAGQITASLEAAGLGPGSRVAIAGSRDAWFVACVIGALEAGCVFTVLDPGSPPSVRQTVLDAFRPDRTLDPHGQLDEAGTPRVSATFALSGRASRPRERLSDDRDAYALFTSGTSSRKKGILGTHTPVVRFLAWQARAFGLSDQDRFALLAGLGHDPVLRDLFAPLTCGGSLHIPSQVTRDDPRLLAAFLNRNRVTVLHITPPLAANLTAIGEKLPAVRLIFCGGDRLSPDQAQRLLDAAPNARLVNGYGLTETPQLILSHEVERGVPLASVPVGLPFPGARVDVETPAGLPCATGELGEIVVYGDHVAKAVLTSEGVTPLASAAGFHSGDLARRDAWGRIHCLGRRDRECKIRGFRVPLDEVEEALRAVPGVERARAVARGDVGGGARLVAFVVADRGRTSEAHIRTVLASRMQAAAVPDQVVILEAMPLSANGKVDDVALAQWDLTAASGSRPPAVEARTQTEDLIIRVWQDVLGTPAVGIIDNFFELGGDSIRAVAALSRLSAALGTPIAVEVLMRNPTPSALASALLAHARHLEEPLVVKVNESGSRPPLWMFHPIGGHVLFIRRLAAELGSDQPLFGVQARGLDGVQPPLDSMEQLVALYSALVRQHQVRGPYFLGGPSFGGRIAFEVAQQLRQEGEEVAMIAMFDSYAPGFPVLAPHHRLWTRLERHRHRWPWLIPDRPLAAVRGWLGGQPQGQASDAKQGGPDYLDELDPSRGALERSVREVIAANQRAAKSRPTAYYPGRVTLFRAEIQPVEDFKADFSDLKNGWGRYAREVTVDIVKGTHHHIMDFPSLTELVALFKARLEESRAQGGAFQ